MKKLSNLPFLFCIAIWFVTIGTILLLVGKGDIELAINKNHHYVFDIFFKYFTYFGDGIIFAFVGIIFLFVRPSLFLPFGLVALLQTILVQVPKRYLFKGTPRPKIFFGHNVPLHFVQGVDVHSYNSFPSGHTATAFAIAAFLSLTIFKNKPILIFFCFVSAFLVGISRVYLLQHFLIDTFVGGLVGIISAMAILLLVPEISIKIKPLFKK